MSDVCRISVETKSNKTDLIIIQKLNDNTDQHIFLSRNKNNKQMLIINDFGLFFWLNVHTTPPSRFGHFLDFI
jgi:hypothetical protein